MKFFNQTVIAVSVAAVFSAASTSALAVDVTEAPATTTISTSQTVNIVFDAACYEQAIIEQEGDILSSSSFNVGSDITAIRSVLSAFSGKISADLTFDVTKRGLNGAVQEIDLDASINSASLTLIGESVGSTGSAYVTVDGLFSGDPDVIAWASSYGFGVDTGYSEAEQNISTTKTAKGMNITEFSSSTTFSASSFDVTDFVGLSLVMDYAFNEANFEVYGVAESFMMAFSNALADSEVNLKVRASYQKGGDAEAVVINAVTASVSCGMEGEGYAGAFNDASFSY